MTYKIPHIIDLDSNKFKDLSLQDWVDANEVLLNELIVNAAEVLINDASIKTITVLEIWMDYEIVAAIDLDKESLRNALEHNMNNWSEREEYEKAATSRDLIAKLNKNI